MERFLFLQSPKTVDVAQLVRASVCGTEGRGFEPHHLPKAPFRKLRGAFYFFLRFNNDHVLCMHQSEI